MRNVAPTSTIQLLNCFILAYIFYGSVCAPTRGCETLECCLAVLKQASYKINQHLILRGNRGRDYISSRADTVLNHSNHQLLPIYLFKWLGILPYHCQSIAKRLWHTRTLLRHAFFRLVYVSCRSWGFEGPGVITVSTVNHKKALSVETWGQGNVAL